MTLSNAGLVSAISAQSAPSDNQSLRVFCSATSRATMKTAERRKALAVKSQIQDTGQRKKIGLSAQIHAAQNPACAPTVRRPREWMVTPVAAAMTHWIPSSTIADATE